MRRVSTFNAFAFDERIREPRARRRTRSCRQSSAFRRLRILKVAHTQVSIVCDRCPTVYAESILRHDVDEAARHVKFGDRVLQMCASGAERVNTVMKYNERRKAAVALQKAIVSFLNSKMNIVHLNSRLHDAKAKAILGCIDIACEN